MTQSLSFVEEDQFRLPWAYGQAGNGLANAAALRTFAGKHAVSLLGAACVTVGLLFTMKALIAEDFVPEDVVEFEAFEINPTVEQAIMIDTRTPPKLELEVEMPPPPPVVDILQTAKPSEPITASGPKPVVELPRIPIAPFSPTVMDAEPTPLVRVPPSVPPRATKSGHCVIGFDISAEGRPFNIAALSCSESLFSRPAIRSVEKWVYKPEIRNGQAITRAGLKTTIRFQLTDEAGRIIPE